MADLRNDLAKARDAWFESDEGIRAADSESLRLGSHVELFLRNRLERAFVAGWNAKERSYRSAVACIKKESSDG